MWRRLAPYLTLTLLCLVVFGAGFTTLPPLDRDESRFAQASRQMLESGDYVRIQFQNALRNKKPAGAYWLQAASASLLGGAEAAPIWAYRLPSPIAAWLAVLALYGFASRTAGREVAFAGSALLAVSLLVISEAHQAKTDALLLLTVVAAMGALGRAYLAPADRPPSESTWPNALAFWIAIGAGLLVKGPITPLIAVLSLLALGVADRRWGWLKALHPLAGLPLALAIAAPWFWAVGSATGGTFVSDAVQQDLLPKLMGAQESHGAPPGYYTALAMLTFWPGSLLLLPALAFAWRQRSMPIVRFLVAWLVPAWLLFEAVPTKLPHYVLPAYPALALLAALVLVRGIEAGGAPLRSRLARVGILLWAVPGLALAGAAIALPMVYGPGFQAASPVLATILVAVTGGGAVLAWRGLAASATRIAVVGGAVGIALVLQVTAPRLDSLWVSPRAAAAVAAQGPRQGPVAVAGYHEPSLVFLLGTATRLVDGTGAADCLAATAHCLALVSDQETPAFRTTLERSGVRAEPLARIPGFNYSRGKPLVLTLYRAASLPQAVR